MASGLLLMLGIVLFALLCLVSVILSIVYFIYSKPGKFIWLGVFFGSVAGLVICIFLTVNKVVDKAKRVARKIESSIRSGLDSSAAYHNYNFADTVSSEQIRSLKKMEPREAKGKVPSKFYHYLGFRDYYRLPLVYPYSIHCMESPSKGDLYNERNVLKFDENDNGEEDCRLYNIVEFAFNSKMLLVCTETEDKKVKKEKFALYDFETGKKMEFEKKEEMLNEAKKLGYAEKPEFYTPENYFELFN
jgi:hypothetical protein